MVNTMTYARNTTGTAMRTRNDIEETLERYGADGFQYATKGNLSAITFDMEKPTHPVSDAHTGSRRLLLHEPQPTPRTLQESPAGST